jgi:hypothetical protein
MDDDITVRLDVRNDFLDKEHSVAYVCIKKN